MEIKLFLSADTEKESLEWIQLIKELVLPEPKLYPSVQAGDIYGECQYYLTLLLCDLKEAKDAWRLLFQLGYLMDVLINWLDKKHVVEGHQELLHEPPDWFPYLGLFVNYNTTMPTWSKPLGMEKSWQRSLL